MLFPGLLLLRACGGCFGGGFGGLVGFRGCDWFGLVLVSWF